MAIYIEEKTIVVVVMSAKNYQSELQVFWSLSDT